MTLALFFIFGALCFYAGIKAAEAVAARQVKEGKMFFWHEGQHTWVGDRDAIIKMIAKRRNEQ
jgi:hypothetical protein